MKKIISKVVRISKHYGKLLLAYIAAVPCKIIWKKYRNVWLFAERGDDARDNGYFFYRYIKKEHPEIFSAYVIRNESPDCKKIRELGGQINYCSFQHYLYYALCKVRLSSSAWGGDLPNAYYFYKTRKFRNPRKKVVFLQHGIIKDFMPSLLAEQNPVDMFICGAKPEADYVKNNFHYKDGVVQYTGLSRFDNLHGRITKNQILVMPTFRTWLQGEDKEAVRESEYVRQWNELLNDSTIEAMLEQNNLELIFYPHYVMQPYLDLFYTNSKNIKIAAFKDYDVQTLLIESKVLITDFSSVFFDFAYMKKPVIYYQFDRADYVEKHYNYKAGYFDYDTMGFGRVCFTEENVRNELGKIVNNKFGMENEFEQKVDGFFPMSDTQNSERIFKAIAHL